MGGWAEAEEKIHVVKGHCLLHVDWMGSSNLNSSLHRWGNKSQEGLSLNVLLSVTTFVTKAPGDIQLAAPPKYSLRLLKRTRLTQIKHILLFFYNQIGKRVTPS